MTAEPVRVIGPPSPRPMALRDFALRCDAMPRHARKHSRLARCAVTHEQLQYLVVQPHVRHDSQGIAKSAADLASSRRAG
jgi:hypothetical protein